MKFVYSLAAAVGALAAPPLLAQSAETHEPVWHPSGKTPSAMYRPKATESCVTARHHQSGKTMLPAGRDCSDQVARRAPRNGDPIAAGR